MADSRHGTEIILVRHGETEFNVAGKLQGTLDSPLTAKGVSAARQLGRRLASASRPVTACYASPLGRAATNWPSSLVTVTSRSSPGCAPSSAVSTGLGNVELPRRKLRGALPPTRLSTSTPSLDVST